MSVDAHKYEHIIKVYYANEEDFSIIPTTPLIVGRMHVI